MLSAVARNAKTPLATRWPASDDLEELGEALDVLAEDPDKGMGVDDATAFTPPVTGPLSDWVISFEPRDIAAVK